MASEKDPRVTIAVRVSPNGLRAIDQRAVDDDRNRSEMIRRLLAFAVIHMPKGWRPPTERSADASSARQKRSKP